MGGEGRGSFSAGNLLLRGEGGGREECVLADHLSACAFAPTVIVVIPRCAAGCKREEPDIGYCGCAHVAGQ